MASQSDEKHVERCVGARVIGFIPLWGRRTAYYKKYIACLHSDDLRIKLSIQRSGTVTGWLK